MTITGTKALLEQIIRQQIKGGMVPKGALLRFIQDEGLTGLVEETAHQFITVALPNDYDLDKIREFIQNPHQWVDGSLLTIERYSKSGENLHLHILRKGYKSKTLIIRDFSRRFKIEPNFINVQRGRNPADYDNRLSYLKGVKVDEGKMENVQKDVEWRIENNLEQIYKINI